MKRLLITAFVVIGGVGLVLAFGAGYFDQSDPPVASPSGPEASTAPAATSDTGTGDRPTSTSTTSVGATAPGAVFGFPASPPTARGATVRRLADGDSFDIIWTDTGERDEVRLLGINAPEGGACFGDGARETIQILIGGDPLQIEAIERDEFGRVIANVWVGELFLNGALVQLGAALTISNDGPHAQVLAQAQAAAEQAQAGLWSPDTCGSATSGSSASLRIQDIRADAPGRDDQNPNGEWIAVANDGSGLVDLTDWSIRDESTRHRFYFPDGFALAAGDIVTVYSGCGDDTRQELFWCDGDPVWNNGGDTGFLVDPDGRFADTYSY